MQKHKYLTDLGLKDNEIMQNICEPDEDREPRWKEQREKYGFDDRETWGLDVSFCQWLYERLMMYKEIGGQTIDLNFHKFNIYGNNMTQLECIDMIIELLIPYLTHLDDIDNKHYFKDLEKICYIWGKILPAMWW